MPKDESVGKTSWAEPQGCCEVTEGENRGAKAQLEFNLAIAVEGAIKCFYKYITNKRRAKESVHPLLDVRRNLVREDEERLRYLPPSLPRSLVVRLAVQQVPSPLPGKQG